MSITQRARTPLRLLAAVLVGYLAMALLTSVSLPTIQLPALSATNTAVFGIIASGGVYAVATKRGWRKDVRYLIQFVAVVLIGYLVGRAIGPTVYEVLPI